MQHEFDWAAQKSKSGDAHRMPPAGCLFHAIKNGDVAEVESALHEGVDLNQYRIGGKSFLRIAAEENKRAICEVLVRNGADLNESNGKLNYSLLHNAAASGNYGLASVLLDLGAYHSPRTSSHATPLHFAARSGFEYFARKLIQFGADVNAQDKKGRSPLLLAFQKAHVGMAKILTEHYGNPFLPDHAGLTPQMVAQQLGLS